MNIVFVNIIVSRLMALKTFNSQNILDLLAPENPPELCLRLQTAKTITLQSLFPLIKLNLLHSLKCLDKSPCNDAMILKKLIKLTYHTVPVPSNFPVNLLELLRSFLRFLRGMKYFPLRILNISAMLPRQVTMQHFSGLMYFILLALVYWLELEPKKCFNS